MGQVMGPPVRGAAPEPCPRRTPAHSALLSHRRALGAREKGAFKERLGVGKVTLDERLGACLRQCPQVLMSVLEKALAGTWTESMANAWTELWQVATVDVRTQEAIAAPF